ncbi:MAG TPA: DUF4097 family beta strand repeat-containing protein [Mycobacteriales bacterium]|nr:DUF4097 family beta strand repeat-containing protein [Mycobacteriales bacterium]
MSATTPGAITRSFDTPRPVELEVRNFSGTIEVTAADTATSTVEVRALRDNGESRSAAERTRIELSAHRLTVAAPEKRMTFGRGTELAVTITVPTDSGVRLRSASADSTCHGRFADLRVQTASGWVDADEVTGLVEIRAASGSVRLGQAGRVEAHTASGAIRVGAAAGDVEVHVASGKVEIGTAGGSVSVKSASSDISVDEVSRGRVELTTASGDLRIGVRPGSIAKLDLFTVSGRTKSDLPIEDSAPAEGSAVEVKAKTVSGNILITRAVGRADAA